MKEYSSNNNDDEVNEILESKTTIEKKCKFGSLIRFELLKVLNFAIRNNDKELIYWCYNIVENMRYLNSELLENIYSFAIQSNDIDLLIWIWDHSNKSKQGIIWKKVFNLVDYNRNIDHIKWCFEKSNKDNYQRQLVWSLIYSLSIPFKSSYILLLKWIYENKIDPTANNNIWFKLNELARYHNNREARIWCFKTKPAVFLHERIDYIIPKFVYS